MYNDILDKLNKIPPKIFFISSYLIGFLVILISITFLNEYVFISLLLTTIPMFIYVLYAYTYTNKPNLSMIADSAYFLGFLFTLTSITLSLYNLSSLGEGQETISKIVNIFGFALVTTIIGLIAKITLVNLQPSVNDLIENVSSNLQDTVNLLDAGLQNSVDRFNSFEQRINEQLETAVKRYTDFEKTK